MDKVVKDLAMKYAGLAVPRYTSYPTALHFNKDLDEKNYGGWLYSLDLTRPVSLYLHVPFCQELCWYCGCSTKVTKRQDLISKYAQILKMEIRKARSVIQGRPQVSHIHWGGGTPHLLSPKDFLEIMSLLKESFDIRPDAELAIELDPRAVTNETIDMLSEAGINRVSLGVQDFDAKVQEAIHRIQPYEMVKSVVDNLRDSGINKINFDLIYGLPYQNIKTLKETILLTKDLSPDRIALFGYAHVPWIRPHQKVMEEHGLPDAEERLELCSAAQMGLKEIGYEMIGIDHFAKPDDQLLKAYKERTLRRNFQGYTTDIADSLISFGASAIGSFSGGYVQNISVIPDYERQVKEKGFAISRGVKVSREDLLRRKVIEELMCYFEVDLNKICKKFEVETSIFSKDFLSLSPYVDDGIVTLHNNYIKIKKGYEPLFVRLVSSCFDAYFNPIEGQHAKAI